MTTETTDRTCSLPMRDADLGLGNANWTKGLQAQTDWVWSAQLNPAAFPNNLARYFLHIPAIFEHQLQFSTTLLFDEPSFRNGVQVSGFIPRPIRELVINFIGQKRRARYTMTHHAVLGTLTALKHGIDGAEFGRKLQALIDYRDRDDIFTPLEQAILRFAECFVTNPKSWSDEEATQLKQLLTAHNASEHRKTRGWMDDLDRARSAARKSKALGKDAVPDSGSGEPVLSDEHNARIVNAQMVELGFVCTQFVALTGVFSALHIPDEDFLPGVMQDLLAPELIAHIKGIVAQPSREDEGFVPPKVALDVQAVVDGSLAVEPARLRGTRVPLTSYEVEPEQATRDKGLAVGGVQTAVFGWSFGGYFPGGLVYLLMHHPELARFEPPYSLPLLFNEDEWRNGTQTGGFTSRLTKELAYLKIYTTTRSRYGLEHHTMYLFNAYLDDYGVGRPPNPPLSDKEARSARDRALAQAEAAVLHVDDPGEAPEGTFTDLDTAMFEWIDRVLRHPHSAQEAEPRLRQELEANNRAEQRAGTRRIDDSHGLGAKAAMARLVDHQIAELAMLVSHMDGLGRCMTILRLESEAAVTQAEGYWGDRPSLFEVYDFVGVTAKARTINELRLNPALAKALEEGSVASPVAAGTAAETGEF